MKQKDKEEAGEKTLVACMDLQGLLLRPALQAPARYYQTKLSVHNLTIFDMASHDATHYLWHEGEAGLPADEFALCIVHCGYQNRNPLLRNDLLKEKQKIVTQKYLKRGHTQRELILRWRERDVGVLAEYAFTATMENPRNAHFDSTLIRYRMAPQLNGLPVKCQESKGEER